MAEYLVTDTRTGGVIPLGGMVTDHCGHTAKLVSVGVTSVVVEWPELRQAEYDAWAVFALTIERTEE